MSAGNDGQSLTPQQIYEMITGGPGPGALDDEQRATAYEVELEQDRADMVLSLAKVVQEGWQGEAAAGAYGTAMPLAERMIGNAIQLKRAQDLLSRQSESFRTAYHSVRPISDPPRMSVDEKYPFDVDHDKAVTQYLDDAQNNIHAYRVYDEASHYNETNMPKEYLAGDRDGGEVSVGVDKGDVIEVGDPGPGGGERRPGGPGPGGQFTDPYLGAGVQPSGFNPGTGGTVGGPGGSQTTPQEYRAPAARYPMPTYPEPGQPSPVSGGVGGEFGPRSGLGAAGGFGPRGGGPGGGGPVRGPGGGPVGGGPVRGTGGGPVSGGPVRGTGGGPVSGGPVRGPGGGVGAGGLAAEEARRVAQAAARSGAGPAGMPMGGAAGRGKDDQDNEHQRKVLMESDGEAVFGSDVLTAPQVIGDDEYED